MKPMDDKEKIVKLKKEIEGFENTIWAYKYEFHDIDDNRRKEVIDSFEKKIELAKAKIKAIETRENLED
ncbi:hypothetical protein [Winogradskyella aquimaris]|uniref:Uncharacterized protein n=1 Tax=Winogradskyella aquimaris TaxID=864074 RepID=A0ABU5EPK3_9FLAO|nr:hypothetical protein [Winogradskyella aquimaris]MDY2588208.1 hypothetical protein [Winogradskyella aquimaris]